MKTFYELLDLEPGATQDQIREQYLFLIQAWHPDKFPNAAQKAKAEEKTKEINAAYESLRNSVKRAEYDRRIRSSRPNPMQEDRGREEAHAAGRRAEDERLPKEQMRKERVDRKRAAVGSSIRVFIDGQERMLRVGELVKATVQYVDGATKEEMGFDILRTHAAVRAAASRCQKYGVEIHVRQRVR
jgi:curved DNA-binding protein CbpA